MFAVDVSTANDLNNAIANANFLNQEATINFQNDITLVPFVTPNLPPFLLPLNAFTNFSPVNRPFIINGNSHTLDGAGSFRQFFVRNGSVVINNLTFANAQAQGGSGGGVNTGSGGGGGGGLGASLYISSGSVVTLTNPSFINSNATGGNGGAAGLAAFFGGGGGGGFFGEGSAGAIAGGGGGGSLAFNGGAASNGGGGGAGVGDDGLAAVGIIGGQGGPDFAGSSGGAGGVIPGQSGAPGASGTGGGGGAGTVISGDGGNGGDGGGGGGAGQGGATGFGGVGGIGGIYGGGGGGAVRNGTGGSAVFAGGGGGGGGGSTTTGAPGGNGGFAGGGGGGGSSNLNPGGIGGIRGFGGGNGAPGITGGTNGPGGGGAGFGGAIFMETNSFLTIHTSAFFEGNTVDPGLAGGDGAGAGSSAGADIFMMSSADLLINNTQNIDIPNPIEGNQGIGGGNTVTGGLTKEGCAILELNGDNTYTGTTLVNVGELRINGSVVTDIEVNKNGILSGNFNIKKNTAGTNNGDLINAGIVSPGVGGVGQISMEGNFVNEPTGILVIDITPTGAVHDTLMVAGTATLNGGVLNVVVNAGNYIAGTQYTIINAPTSGQFAQVIETGVNANLIDIDVTYSSVILTVTNNRIFENQIISGGVANGVAECIRDADITPGSDFGLFLEQLGLLSGTDVSRALYALSPVNYGALDWINARNNSLVVGILAEHLFQLCCSPRDCCNCNCNKGFWVDVFGNWMDNKRFDNLTPYDADALGVVLGVDYCFCQNYTIGLALGYTHTWIDWEKHFGNGESDSYYVALYGSYQGCWLNIDLSLLGGESNHELKRNIRINAEGILTSMDLDPCDGTSGLIETPMPVEINRSAKSDPWAYFITAHLGLSSDWDWCCVTFEPFGLVDYHYFNRDCFKEHGADTLDLIVKKHDQNMLRGEAGLRAYYTRVCECSCLAPYIGLSWVGEFPLDNSNQRARFIGQDCVFTVTSYDSSIQFGSPEVGVKWTRNSGFSFSIGYKGLFSSKAHINQVDARLEWIF